MGYFPNGTEYQAYEARYCAHCRNDTDDKPCWILGMHLALNYDQRASTDDGRKAAHLLGSLIPREELTNGECVMFRPCNLPALGEDPNAKRVRLRLLPLSGLLSAAAEEIERLDGDAAMVRELEERA